MTDTFIGLLVGAALAVIALIVLGHSQRTVVRAALDEPWEVRWATYGGGGTSWSYSRHVVAFPDKPSAEAFSARLHAAFRLTGQTPWESPYVIARPTYKENSVD